MASHLEPSRAQQSQEFDVESNKKLSAFKGEPGSS